MAVTSLLSEDVGIVGVIDPDAYAASTVASDWVDMGKFPLVLAILAVGSMGASSTVDAKLEQATDSGGTGVKDITGKAITQLTQASTDNDKQALINVRAEELDLSPVIPFAFVRLSVTSAVASVDYGAVVLGGQSRHAPASDNDLASVDEIVN